MRGHAPRPPAAGWVVRVQAIRLCPTFRRLLTRLPVVNRRHAAFNADRLLNRFIIFPRLRGGRSVGSTCSTLPITPMGNSSTPCRPIGPGSYCHDVNPFRCLFDPGGYPRPRWFRAMSQRILSGLRKAAVVFHSTAAVGEEIRRAGLVDPDRLVLAPYGVSPEFSPGSTQPAVDLPWLAELDGRPWLLHVGTCNKRKRIDVLLDVVSAVRETLPDLRLVKVGGEWTADHRERIARRDLAGAITHVTGLTRVELAEVYRRATVVLVPSEAEGFGLPVIEGLACGAAVVASEIPALREAGGPAAAFVPVGDVGAWSDRVAKLITDPAAAPPRADRLAWAARFTWTAHAGTIARAYHRLLCDRVV